MQWKRIIRQLKKFYSLIWDNIEKLKTVSLSLLIVLSIFLTYNLWTFTPNNNLLESEGPIETKIPAGKIEKLSNVIQPRQVVVHYKNTHYWAVNKNQSDIYKKLQNSQLSGGDSVNYSPDIQSDGIEVIYPTSIPVDVLKGMFRFNNENPFKNKRDRVEKLRVYYSEQDSEKGWMIQFIFERKPDPTDPEIMQDPYVYQFRLSDEPSIRALINNKVDSEKDMVTVDQFELEDKKFYLPRDTMEVESYPIYRANNIDPQLLVKALLSGEVFTKKSEDKIIYGKSKSVITYYRDSENFQYLNLNRQDEVLRQHAIIQSLDFINLHAGWTNQFHLYDYYNATQGEETSNLQKEITYRMIINGLPVMGSSMAEIYLELTNNQTNEYERSLIYLQGPVNKAGYVKKGSEVIEALKTLPNANNISGLTVGYSITNEDGDENGPYQLEPAWYYKLGSSWLKVKFEELEPLKEEGG